MPDNRQIKTSKMKKITPFHFIAALFGSFICICLAYAFMYGDFNYFNSTYLGS